MFPVVLDTVTSTMLNHIMACYTVFLATGHTIYQRQVRATTIEKYVHNAATFVAFFDTHPHRDARKEMQSTNICDPIKKIIDQVKRFEKIPDKREAYTLAMQKELHSRMTSLPKDCLLVALFQWFGTALQGGNRRYEWCQDRSHRTLDKFELNPCGECMAFTMADIEFMGRTKSKLTTTYALAHRNEVYHARLTYRWQKNLAHGEKKYYTRNKENTACDSVGHLLDICDRSTRLLGVSVTNRPLAVYRDANGSIYHITSTDVEITMQDLAKTVYNITAKAELKKWSCHSLRVGACCILWAKGHSGEFIQRALRWKGETWKDYVRDLLVQSNQHNATMNDVWNLPTF